MRYVVNIAPGDTVAHHLRVSVITELVVNIKDHWTNRTVVYERLPVPNQKRTLYNVNTSEEDTVLCALFRITVTDHLAGTTDSRTDWISMEK